MTIEREKNVHLNRERLFRLAEAEEGCASIAVGGLASELGLLEAPDAVRPPVFSRLIELARRMRRLSVETLAEEADVELSELVSIEDDDSYVPQPRTVYRLSEVLGLPVGKLLELSGLAALRDEKLSEAAYRFAARSEPMEKLSKAEREAFEEFVKVLGEASEGG